MGNAHDELVSNGVWKPEEYSSNKKEQKERESETRTKVPPPPQHSDAKPNQIFEVSADRAYCEAGYLGLCVLAFLDGSPMNTDLSTQLALLEKVQYAPLNKGRLLQFMWADGLCRSSFGQQFDVSPDK